jgi:hypothetical protein
LVLVVRSALFLLGRLLPESRESDRCGLRDAARTLLWVAAVYAAVMATNPWLFGRYLLPIAPWLCAVVVLDGCRLMERLRAVSRGQRARAALVAAVTAALSLVSLAWHAPALADRWHEVWHRYQGPMDFAVAFLNATYDDTEDLVIATNYEDVVLMYYLGARVRTPAALRAEGLTADVVIPRRAHGAWQLRPALQGTRYRVTELPVVDLPFNNIPELYPWKPLRDYGMPTHRFRTPHPGLGEPGLQIYWRGPPGEPDARTAP